MSSASHVDSYRALLTELANGETVSPQKLAQWRIEEELLLVACYHPAMFRYSSLQAAHFDAPVHGLCWQAICEMHDADPNAEKLIGENLLSRMRAIDEKRLIGPSGFVWLTSFQAESPISTEYGLNHHLRFMLGYHRCVRMARQSAELSGRINTDPDITSIEADFIAAASDWVYQFQGEGMVEPPISDLPWDARTINHGSLVTTGNKWIDIATGGGHGRGEFLAWGGGTNCGKSYAAERMVREQARAGLKVLYISCEDPRELMWCRLLADYCDPPCEPKEIRNRKADPEVVERANEALKHDFGDRVFVVERKKPTIGQLCSLIRSYHYTVGLDSVIIDYLQAITEDEPMQNRTQEMGSINSKLKRCFTECFVAGVAFSQYNRDSYKDGAEPGMTSFKYCGDIENEAEIVVLYWRDSDEVLHCKVPKLKWSRGSRLRFIVPIDEVTGCQLTWVEDNTEGAD